MWTCVEVTGTGGSASKRDHTGEYDSELMKAVTPLQLVLGGYQRSRKIGC